MSKRSKVLNRLMLGLGVFAGGYVVAKYGKSISNCIQESFDKKSVDELVNEIKVDMQANKEQICKTVESFSKGNTKSVDDNAYYQKNVNYIKIPISSKDKADNLNSMESNKYSDNKNIADKSHYTNSYNKETIKNNTADNLSSASNSMDSFYRRKETLKQRRVITLEEILEQAKKEEEKKKEEEQKKVEDKSEEKSKDTSDNK